MRLERIALIGLTLLTGILSCKKDEEETTYESFSGSLNFSVPRYVSRSSTHVLVPSGAYRSDGGGYGYYWTDSIDSYKDTTRYEGGTGDGAYTFVVPKDTLCTMTVTCYIFAKGYSTTALSRYVTIVNPLQGGSLTMDGIDLSTVFFTDTRDRRQYPSRLIGSHYWMTKNLAYAEAGVPMEYCDVMTYPYGRYYTWEEAQTVCPPGWHLPSGEEWLDLAVAAGAADARADATFAGVAGNLMVDALFNRERMWEYWPQVKITNRSGFSAIPTGYATMTDDTATFYGNLEYAVFWTADSYNDEQGLFRYINLKQPDVMLGSGHKDSFRASVRCVKD